MMGPRATCYVLCHRQGGLKGIDMGYTSRQVVRWIEDIDNLTATRCLSVRAEARELQDAGGWQPGADTHERLFAALLTGESERLITRYLSSDWTSWIENRPFYLSLSTHPRVIIDLVPCSGEQFVDKYGCTPGQLATLILRMPDAVRINVRNDTPESYTTDAVIEAMGDILVLSKHKPSRDCFYRLSPIRNTAFELLGVNFAELKQQASVLAESYTDDVQRRLAAAPADMLRLVTREGGSQPHGQLVGRITYYLAARQLWPSEATDPVIEDWISHRSPLSFGLEPAELAERFARIYTTHHLYTAPLTGALGGSYGWAPEELNFAISRRSAGPVALNLPLATWLFDLQAGIVKLPMTPATVYDRHLSRRPTDREWQNFLSVVADNRPIIKAYWNMLEEVFLVAGSRVAPSLRPDVNLDDLQTVLDAVSPSRFEHLLLSCVSSGAKIGASGGADVIGSAAHVSPPIVTAGAKLLGQVAERQLEEFRAGIGKITWRRTARTALTRAVGNLRTQ